MRDCEHESCAASRLLEHDSDQVPLFSAVIQHTRGILERDAAALVDAAAALRTVRPLLSASAAEDAGAALADGQQRRRRRAVQ